MRTRTRGGFTVATGMVFGGPTGSPYAFAPQQVNVGVEEVMLDTVHPGFKAGSARGNIYCSPMQRTKISKSSSLLDSRWLSPDGLWEEGGTRFCEGFPSLPPHVEYYTDALAEAAAVNSAYAGVSPSFSMAAVTVAELDKTLAMFGNAGKTASGFANAMIVAARSLVGRRNTPKNQRRAMAAIANGWLEARYGWLPVIYDVQGAAKALSKPHSERETSRGTQTIRRSYDGQVVGGWRGTYGYDYSVTQETVYRAGILYQNDMDLNAEMASRFGLSAADALTVPWELVRLSFVVDWFIDIGDWLRAISPKPGTKTLASWLTVKKTCTVRGSNPFVNAADGWSGSASGGGMEHVYEEYTRSTPLSAPIIPGLGSGLSTNRSIDAAMLSFQNLKGLLGFSGRRQLR